MKLLEKKQVLVAAAAALLVAGFALLLYRPLHNRLNAMSQSRQSKVLAIIQARTELEQLPTLKAELAALEQRIGNYDNRVPADRELGSFLQIIADSMSKHNLKDQVVQPENEIAMDKLICIPLKLQCSGRLREIYDFFNSMQKFERVIRIESVELRNGPDLNGNLNMVAQANIYYRNSKM